MKIFKSAFFGLMAAMALAGCSSEILPDDPDINNGGDEDGVYLSFDISMPDGMGASRSTTVDGGGSSDGVEIGSADENAVNSMLIVLARQSDNGFIAAGEVQSNRISSKIVENQPQYTGLTRVNLTNIAQFYEELGEGQVPTVNVFVFCNPTKFLVTELSRRAVGDKTWLNLTCSVTEGFSDKPNVNTSIWSPGSFLMNSVGTNRGNNMSLRALPNTLAEWDAFNKSENPFHLSDANATEENEDLPDNSAAANRGVIRVQRSVARFDFKDGSPTKDQTYEVLYQYINGTADNTKPLVNVKLLRMCLVNMCNSFYYLPRVSDNGQLDGANYSLLGREKPWDFDATTTHYSQGNYVVGPYAIPYGAEQAIETGFTTYFNYPFFDDNGTFNNGTEVTEQWDVYEIADVLAGAKDNYQGKHDYVVWRYVTENVIPYPRTNQVNGISTGVVFKGRLLGSEFAHSGKVSEESWEEDIYENMAKCLNGEPFQLRRKDHPAITGTMNPDGKADPILYYFENKLYMTWEHIRQAAIQAAVTVKEDGNDLQINRSNSLYRAVFGDGPIPAGQLYLTASTKDAKPVAFTDPRWDANPESAQYKLYMQSADYAWTQWDKAGQYVAAIGQGDAEKLKPLIAMREAITAAGITIYQSSLDENGKNPGYYCYYYYWNRHNDNGLAGVMGPMEFDVVRNNVYKLSVDKIARLGHPRLPENDPEKPTPGTPDEVANVYLDVAVEIVPWAVRVNSINF